jgi:hypothetical protein
VLFASVSSKTGYKSAEEFLAKMDACELDGKLSTEVQKLTEAQCEELVRLSWRETPRTKSKGRAIAGAAQFEGKLLSEAETGIFRRDPLMTWSASAIRSAHYC